MGKYILQMGDDGNPTQTMYKNKVAIKNSENQLNSEGTFNEISCMREIVDQFSKMIQESKSSKYKKKLNYLTDDKYTKCIIKNVGSHGTPENPYKIFLAIKGNFYAEEIAHIEEVDENNDLKFMNRLFVIIPENKNINEKIKEIKFWNANFQPQIFNTNENHIYTYDRQYNVKCPFC